MTLALSIMLLGLETLVPSAHAQVPALCTRDGERFWLPVTPRVAESLTEPHSLFLCEGDQARTLLTLGVGERLLHVQEGPAFAAVIGTPDGHAHLVTDSRCDLGAVEPMNVRVMVAASHTLVWWASGSDLVEVVACSGPNVVLEVGGAGLSVAPDGDYLVLYATRHTPIAGRHPARLYRLADGVRVWEASMDSPVARVRWSRARVWIDGESVALPPAGRLQVEPD